MKKILTLVLLLFLNTIIAQKKNVLEITRNQTPKDRICFALYTVHNKILKLTAQFYPIKDYEPFRAFLQIKKGADWETVQESEIEYPGYTAHFRIEKWDDTQEVTYRVAHNNNKAFYEGTIQKNPIHKKEITILFKGRVFGHN